MCYKLEDKRLIIVNDIDEAVALCDGAPDYCFGFSDVGCDKKGPFVLCDSGWDTTASAHQPYGPSEPYNICFYWKN